MEKIVSRWSGDPFWNCCFVSCAAVTARKLSSLCEAKKVISEKSEAGQWVMDGDGVSRDSLVLILLDGFKMV